jgi:hypothetical protein
MALAPIATDDDASFLTTDDNDIIEFLLEHVQQAADNPEHVVVVGTNNSSFNELIRSKNSYFTNTLMLHCDIDCMHTTNNIFLVE